MITQPVCRFCTHYRSPRLCKAFSGQIPALIWSGRSNHSRALSGQENGVTFEAKDDRAAEQAVRFGYYPNKEETPVG